ncbi:hypothetical protein HPB51_008999 [Rhipicephalus microplus]|uniref:Uncharacterized protein n=1 Tax=Rhipicephalus microplus TaxID=6941 RepID=A0A9J6F019_RHIMP|nr:hypothetical protein HPB51_008999 [Rhipicephalus microplus]
MSSEYFKQLDVEARQRYRQKPMFESKELPDLLDADVDKFRELRTASREVDGYDDWLAALTADLDATRQSITTTPINPNADPHLLHLWDARRGLTKRWKRNPRLGAQRKRLVPSFWPMIRSIVACIRAKPWNAGFPLLRNIRRFDFVGRPSTLSCVWYAANESLSDLQTEVQKIKQL